LAAVLAIIQGNKLLYLGIGRAKEVHVVFMNTKY